MTREEAQSKLNQTFTQINSAVDPMHNNLIAQSRDAYAKRWGTQMSKAKEDKHYDFILLMLTDVLKEGTDLIFLGDEDVINQAFSCQAKDNTVFLPKVMSRKKQIIPMLSTMWG